MPHESDGFAPTTDILAGIQVVEFGGIGPAPFCAMLLADHGASVLRIARPGGTASFEQAPRDVLNRAKATLTLDLSMDTDLRQALAVCRDADVVIEGFRPGVMERLGLGPVPLMNANPKLVYARMTGWGQAGPLSGMAGHDINYIGLSGVLHACGKASEPPIPPLNLAGDFGGGGMLLAFGILAACLRVQRGGQGQLIDCAMTDGSAVLMTMIYSFFAQGLWQDNREANLVDGGCPFYAAYETSDGKFMAVGALEDQFYNMFVEALGIAVPMTDRWSRENWPSMKQLIATRFREKSRDEWTFIFASREACVTPVLSLAEAPLHHHNLSRGTFRSADGVVWPAPAPRFHSLVPAGD